MTKLPTEKLGEIPETMLITLWAKSEESKFKEPFLIDKRAEEIIWKIDYDFTKFKKSKFSQAGVCLRASLIDREVREFIEKILMQLLFSFEVDLMLALRELEALKSLIGMI